MHEILPTTEAVVHDLRYDSLKSGQLCIDWYINFLSINREMDEIQSLNHTQHNVKKELPYYLQIF